MDQIQNWPERLGKQKDAREGLIISLSDRKNYIKQLRGSILKQESEIIEALQKDLGKTEFEILGSEIGLVLQEIRYVLKHVRSWTKPKRKRMPISHWPASATVGPEPYGLVLIISPWNYPIQLAFIPLIAAIAAGNSVHLKLSEKSVYINPVIKSIIESTFPNWLVTVSDIKAELVESTIMASQQFDKIFFTGGGKGGKAVAKFAAKSLTPISLELGGKSPAVIDGTSSISVTAKRLVWAKMLNGGQSCIAPDFILVQKKHETELLKELKTEFERVLESSETKLDCMASIVDQDAYQRLNSLIRDCDVFYSGTSVPERRWMHPTILQNVAWTDEIMRNEIFGPLLPVLTYSDESDLFEQLKKNQKPLAFYLFSSDKILEQKIVDTIPFGAGGSNQALMQIASSKLPHGGVGPSGMGMSHGYYGFMEFSHLKSWHRTPIWPDIRLRYAPYNKNKLNLLKRLLR
jgi:aldehyde dehydrogenase (NAD+)